MGRRQKEHERDHPTLKELERICADDAARRDLLWLRAHEKADPESVDSLERADPELRSRMTRFVLESGLSPELLADATDRDRREAFGRLWDQRLEQLCRADKEP